VGYGQASQPWRLRSQIVWAHDQAVLRLFSFRGTRIRLALQFFATDLFEEWKIGGHQLPNDRRSNLSVVVSQDISDAGHL